MSPQHTQDSHKIIRLPDYLATRHRLLMGDVANRGVSSISDLHCISVERDVAMLVEPVNDHPFVFVPPDTLHIFESVPGSGTDRLRKRVEASAFFAQVVEAQQKTAQQHSRGEMATSQETAQTSCDEARPRRNRPSF